MAEPSVKCTFHHVSSDAVDLISSSIGIHTKYNENTTQVFCLCSLSKANQIRSTLANVIVQYPQIWLSINLPNNSNGIYLPFNTNIANEIHVSFGSLLSTSKFLIHDTPLNDRTQWTIKFSNEQKLIIECQPNQKTDSSVCLTLPMKCVNKNILVIDGNTYSDIIFNIDTMTTDVREYDNIKNDRLYGNNPIIESLSRCSEILIRMSSKTNVDQFLDYFHSKYQCEIFYTVISIQRNVCDQWKKIEFNWYPTADALYAISMLHSLGYLFDDKYLIDKQLQSIMVDLAEEDEKRFYQLTLRAFDELQKCHWLDLTTIFNRNQLDRIQVELRNKFCYIGVVHLTPTRLHLLPKEKTEGHRAMRHESFQSENNFCLVYLKSDPSDKYLNDNTDVLAYFQTIFECGIVFGGNHYHLFGSSNSQLKEHSFWFIKASTLDDIDQKRLQLGQLNQIENLSTYITGLDLWFSRSSSTGIKLIYCQDEQDFDKRVQQEEICVMNIDDIKRNGYCFTNGNGFISKGLAKLVVETLSLCPQDFQQNILPSAYQIQMAGCKGLVIVDPQSTFEQFYIKIRPSMKKFECNNWTLDICEYSQSKSARLNNQIIVLMSDLGVPNETFLHFQKQWFDKKPSRFMNSDDLLKNKIPLPINECRYMYGCAFESRLKSGTCFFRYQVLNEHGKPLPNPQFQSVEGRVLVTKNPCPHAGDLLVLTAVNLPELYDLKDVIVFSSEGDRPDFNKIGRSSLGGDKYFVYWGGEFHLKYSVSPLDYIAKEQIKHPTPICAQDIIKYYFTILGTPSFGEIYNMHAMIVDRNIENHQQRTCQKLAIELARMLILASDSGKTGYIINKECLQEICEIYGKEYPDFLMKHDKQYYKSQSINGILYRNAVFYKNGKINELNNVFAQMNIDDKVLAPSLRD
ncbi:unnamed protein product [Rotaria sp. Silwood2]|nr:unnamed protein product [Rotaria sp. Silwood2]CAF4047674.1 unnamed protein product [Rotaria sp. Silwood2]